MIGFTPSSASAVSSSQHSSSNSAQQNASPACTPEEQTGTRRQLRRVKRLRRPSDRGAGLASYRSCSLAPDQPRNTRQQKEGGRLVAAGADQLHPRGRPAHKELRGAVKHLRSKRGAVFQPLNHKTISRWFDKRPTAASDFIPKPGALAKMAAGSAMRGKGFGRAVLAKVSCVLACGILYTTASQPELQSGLLASNKINNRH